MTQLVIYNLIVALAFGAACWTFGYRRARDRYTRLVSGAAKR